jgi:hypothetical protein
VKKLASALVAAAVAALVAASLALGGGASQVMVGAKLTAAAEVPVQVVKNTKAKGSFAGEVAGKKLTWRLTFSGLSGPATAAHIHMAATGKSGPVVVPLCGPCKSGAKGSATLTASLLKALKKHLLYVNVHTAKNPAGEIRGQLSAR